MRDLLGSNTILGYCTNVHAGADWAQTKANLHEHALSVKELVCPDDPMGVGLWLSAQTAAELLHEQNVHQLRDWLCEQGLIAYTLNGFPYGDFHGQVVKHAVYEPPWWDLNRLLYSRRLAIILAELLPEAGEGSISTLPLGWRTSAVDNEQLRHAAELLREFAQQMHRLEEETGRLIHLNIEAEPGCVLGDNAAVLRFFQEHLLDGAQDDLVRRHLRVCHDVCHAAVMFEDQRRTFDAFRDSDIRIGKVQLSSAVRADFRNRSPRERSQMLSQLKAFSEDRYLHQTMIETDAEGHTFFDDLPHALAAAENPESTGDEWRVHFHVPIHLREFGLLQTTQKELLECVSLLWDEEISHWEVETYAWSVLPEELRAAELADGIAKELQWMRDIVQGCRNEP